MSEPGAPPAGQPPVGGPSTGSPGTAGRGVARATGLIAVVTMASRVLGFVRWLVFAAAVGAGTVGSAYSTANSVPNVLYEVAAGGALAAAVVPLVTAALARGRRDEADAVASAVLTWALLVLVPLAALLWVAARPVASALVPADAHDRATTVDLAATMLRWFAPQVPLYGIGIVCAGVLQAHRRFAAAALAPLLSSLVVVATYATYGHARGGSLVPGDGAIALLAGGTTLGVVALSLPLLFPVRRAGVRLRPTLRLPAGTGARLRSLVGAGVLALLAQQAAVLATIRVANAGDGAGVLTVYQYGQAVYLLPYAVLAVPVATAVFPALAHGAALDADAAAPRLAGSLRVVAVACGVGAGALLAAAGAIGRFFAAIDAGRHGASATTGATAGATGAAAQGVDVAPAMTGLLLALAPGLLGYGLAALLTRALYVRGAPRAASAWVGAGWLVAAAVPFAAIGADGATRLLVIGAASSAGMTLTAAGLALAVRRHWPAAALAGVGRTALAAAVGGLLGGAAGWLLDGSLRAVVGGGALPAVAAGVVEGALGVAVAVAVVALADRTALAGLLARVGRKGGRAR